VGTPLGGRTVGTPLGGRPATLGSGEAVLLAA
jgi:hypothetical protein